MFGKWPLIFISIIVSTHPIVVFSALPKMYKIEVIVFENKDKAALAEEWPLDPGKPSLNDAMNLVTDPSSDFGRLTDSQLTLTDAKKRLQKRYHLILHQGWRQTITNKNKAPKIHIVGGKMYDLDNEGPSYEVDGIITLSSGSSLQANADLLFKKPMKVAFDQARTSEGLSAQIPTTALFSEIADRNHWQQEENTRIQSFRLKESTRLRSNEIHYIDHPMYGVIIMVTPEKGVS